jgi:CRISPR/Cas system-associated protein endoribonuclease Cas2
VGHNRENLEVISGYKEIKLSFLNGMGRGDASMKADGNLISTNWNRQGNARLAQIHERAFGLMRVSYTVERIQVSGLTERGQQRQPSLLKRTLT